VHKKTLPKENFALKIEKNKIISNKR